MMVCIGDPNSILVRHKIFL
jgi:hypothetical protein